MTTIGDRLKQSIVNHGFTLKSFAQKFEIHYTGLTMVTKNERPLGMTVLMQIKKALPDLDTEWLLFGTKRDEVSNYENPQEIRIVGEEVSKVENSDIFLRGLLQCLDNESVQEKLKDILNK